jgi:2',3'-cyclic-nucleotide 2'-phosphodiesterase (5'-nucleotidase family)
MVRNGVLTFCILFMSCLLILISSLSFGEEVRLTLIYSANTFGEVVPCGCMEAGNAGGMSRRSHYIQGIRDEGIRPLIFDAGDALAIGRPGDQKERKKAQKRAEFILKLYETMGYDAVNIGDTDLQLGVNYLKALQKHSPIRLLSANLKDKRTNQVVFSPYILKEVNGSKIGIIGLMSGNSRLNVIERRTSYIVEDPVKAASAAVNAGLSKCDIIIALAHLDSSEIESLAQHVPRFSVIIGGENRTYMDARMINRSLWVQTDAFGSQIGKLGIGGVKGSYEFRYENVLTVLHPEMEGDLRIEEMVARSGDLLKRPLP